MASHVIHIQGARTHNLRDLDVALPWEAWTAVCGVSGSGKSSLVLDTLGAESRRRFLGALGRTAQGQELLARPDVDRIEGLPPAVLVSAGERAPGPFETVGTLTETSHALRALWSRAATAHCPRCGAALPTVLRPALVAQLAALPAGTKLQLLARLGRGPDAVTKAQRAGYVRLRVDGGTPQRIEEVEVARVKAQAPVDVVLDRIVVQPGATERVRDSVEQALALGGGALRTLSEAPGGPVVESGWAARPTCTACELGYPPLAPRLFSATHPEGACPTCRGLGEVAAAPARPKVKAARPAARGRFATKGRPPAARAPHEATPERVVCPDCAGARIAPYGRAARLCDLTLPGLEALPLSDALAWLEGLPQRAQATTPPAPLSAASLPPLEEARERLRALTGMGLAHLALGRGAQRLSRGELRRTRLAAALSLGMSGLLYLLDEPMASSHVSEREPLRARLRALVKGGSTVVSVEHDLEAVRAADHVLELGPGAGREGGALVAEGTPKAVAQGATPLAQALSRKPEPARAAPRLTARGAPTWIELEGLRLRNLRDLSVRLPTPGFTCVTGLSGAGKSTLVFGCLHPLAQAALDLVPPPPPEMGQAKGLAGFRHVSVAEARAARHPRASVLSLLGVFAPLRELYAATLEARARGWKETRFSLALPGGRCETCRGTGLLAASLAAARGDLPESQGPCEACGGRRYGPEVEAVRVKGLSFPDLMALTLGEAAPMFRDLPKVGPTLAAASEVGLAYLPLGRAATQLSTGEVLRLRLAAALGKGGTGPTLYLLDEPAAGLHPDDVRHLQRVLDRLVEAGHTLVAVEHDLDLIRGADHVLDLGPGPGDAGGQLLHQGTPASLLSVQGSATAAALKARRR